MSLALCGVLIILVLSGCTSANKPNEVDSSSIATVAASTDVCSKEFGGDARLAVEIGPNGRELVRCAVVRQSADLRRLFIERAESIHELPRTAENRDKIKKMRKLMKDDLAKLLSKFKCPFEWEPVPRFDYSEVTCKSPPIESPQTMK